MAGTTHAWGLGSQRRPDTPDLVVDDGMELGRRTQADASHSVGMNSERYPGTSMPVDELVERPTSVARGDTLRVEKVGRDDVKKGSRSRRSLGKGRMAHMNPARIILRS